MGKDLMVFQCNDLAEKPNKCIVYDDDVHAIRGFNGLAVLSRWFGEE